MTRPTCPADAAFRRTPVPSVAAVLGVALLVTALLPATSRAACTPTSPPNDANVTCSGTDSTGYDGSGADNLTITTSGAAVLDDSGALDGAILVDDDSTVTIGAAATVRVTEQNGFGIRGDDDNSVVNNGRIELNADDTRAISLDQNTTGVAPNGAVNNGTIDVNGDRSRALETVNATISNSGVVDLVGDETRGISTGSRSDFSKAANVTNTGVVNVLGDDAYGMKVGDNWIDGSFVDDDSNASTPTVFVPSAAGVRNLSGGEINVEGARSTGIFAGDETNLDGDHDSFVRNVGAITVTGTDAVGVSVGGNGRLDRYDVESTDPVGLVTFDNGGTLTGDADAGPLVVIRDFVAGKENRIRNNVGAKIEADLTNQGDPDRAVAIRGTDGNELVINFGAVRGDVELGGGDDRFVQGNGGTYAGDLLGGGGRDELILIGAGASPGTFDVGVLQAFEAVRIFEGAPWRLTSSAGFTGLTQVEAGGTLDVPTPITLGGDLEVASEGTIQVVLDGTTAPLSIQGQSTLDGRLIVEKGPNLTPSPTPYRVVLANGGYTGQFADITFPDAVGSRIFTASYDTLGVLALFQDVGLVGVARGANQRAVAQYLTDLIDAGGNETDLQDLLDDLDEVDDLGIVYDSLSPEGYDAQTTVSVDAGRRIASMLFTRARECQPGEIDPWNPNHTVLPCHSRRVSPFAAALGSFRSRDGFDGHTRYDAQIGGIMAGVDFAPIGGLDLTLAVSSQGGTINTALGRNSSLAIAELTGAAAYGFGGLRVQGAISYGHGFHDDRRRIVIDDPAASVRTRGQDDHESDRTLVATEIGHQIPVGPVAVEPVAGFDWAWMKQDALKENGAGGFGLDVDERDDEIGSVRAGLRLSSVYEHRAYLGPWFEWMTGIWRPNLDVAWRQYVEGNQRDLDARLQGGTDTVGAFTVQGEEDEVGAEIGAGFRFVPEVANRLRFDVRYQAYVAEHTLEQNLTGQVAVAF